MKRKAIVTTIATIALMTMLSGCDNQESTAQTIESAPITSSVSASESSVAASSAESTGSSEVAQQTQTESARQDGERFQTTIMLEGMESTVNYEHVVNDAVGIEMDYDYESFVRRSSSSMERFISAYDNADAPMIYLDVTFRPEGAEAVAASIRESLANSYDTNTTDAQLDGAGKCIKINATSGNELQTIYVIPASDGCRVATAHYTFESAEGFGTRFSQIVNTLKVIGKVGEAKLSDDQVLAAVKKYCITNNPSLADMANSEDFSIYWEIASSDADQVVILYRSYTNALIRYYVNPVSGETYITEFVPGITPEEERTDESFNVRDYLAE